MRGSCSKPFNMTFFLVIRNNYILIKKPPQLSDLILKYLSFRKNAIISYLAGNASYTEKSSFGDIIGPNIMVIFRLE